MIERALWLERVQMAWARRSIVWLSGVRRVGKMTLARMLPDVACMNCDLPSTLRALADPELFLNSQGPGSVLVFGEVHHLDDPSRLLKIAADEYPQLVECKINPDKLNTSPIEAFRSLYPEGENFIVNPAVKTPYRICRGDLVFTISTTEDLS